MPLRANPVKEQRTENKEQKRTNRLCSLFSVLCSRLDGERDRVYTAASESFETECYCRYGDTIGRGDGARSRTISGCPLGSVQLPGDRPGGAAAARARSRCVSHRR